MERTKTNSAESTRREILSQTAVWADACRLLKQNNAFTDSEIQRIAARQILFAGCGSTYYLSLSAAAHLRALTGWPALALPSSELWLNTNSYAPASSALVAISRSGTTTETLQAIDAYHACARGPIVTIQCVPDTPMLKSASSSFVLPSGAEQSVVQTRSFAGMLVTAVGLNFKWARRDDLLHALDQVPQSGARLLDAAQSLARDWGPRLDLDRIYFLGSGARYGLACEASLKMKEMSLTNAEPFHSLEFRHGPKSMLGKGALVVGLVSEHMQDQECRLLAECAALGAQVVALGERVPTIGDGVALSFESNLPDPVRDVLYLPALQLLAYERAVAKGLDPDRPRHLDAVVTL